MQTRTIIDRVEIEPQTGNIGIRIRKQVINEAVIDPQTGGAAIVANDYHRTMIAPNADAVAQMAAVNAHLATMGYPAIKAEDVTLLNDALTSAPVAALRTAKAAENAAKE